jgi:hypothetical protein
LRDLLCPRYEKCLTQAAKADKAMDCAGCPDRENLKDRELVFTPDDQQRAARLWLMVFTGKYYEGVDMGRTGIVDPGGAHKGRFQENMPRIG